MEYRHADKDLEQLESNLEYNAGLAENLVTAFRKRIQQHRGLSLREAGRLMSDAKRRLAQVFPPGEFIREELEARGWTQGDLAVILGRPIQVVNGIVNG